MLVVGAPYKNVGSTQSAGKVYVFQRACNVAGCKWSQRQVLTAPQPATTMRYGSAVAVAGDGSVVFVGAPGAASNRGALLVYRRVADGSYKHDETVTAKDGAAGDRYGEAVACDSSGRAVVIAAPGKTLTKTSQGKAYILAWRDSTKAWDTFGSLVSWTPSQQEQLGYSGSVAISADGKTIVLGAQSVTGIAYVFRQASGRYSSCQPSFTYLIFYACSMAARGRQSSATRSSSMPRTSPSSVAGSPPVSRRWPSAAPLVALTLARFSSCLPRRPPLPGRTPCPTVRLSWTPTRTRTFITRASC